MKKNMFETWQMVIAFVVGVVVGLGVGLAPGFGVQGKIDTSELERQVREAMNTGDNTPSRAPKPEESGSNTPETVKPPIDTSELERQIQESKKKK